MDTVQVTALEGQLGSLLESIKEKDTLESWDAVGSVCRSIANSLRTRGEGADTHTLLGKSSLPQNLASLITLALHGSPYPSDEYTAPIFEMLRVSANLCLDHDPNRGYILEAGLPQVIVSLLEGYAERTSSPATIVPLDLSIAHLHVVRTAIGVLLNASLGYDAVKFRLISLETAVTIIKLSATIYPPMSWLGITFDETTKEAWTLRSGISSWAWRTVSELKDTKDDPKDESTRQILGPDVLPWVTPALSRFMPPYEIAANPSLLSDSSFYTNLVNTDFETLEETCTLLESLSLDVEDIRLALARGYCFPAEHLGVSCFKTMVDFIEDGSYPPTWNHPTISRDDRERKEKKFNICKAALINLAASHRDDLVICASLSLGNLSRREKTSTALLSSPISLAPVLASDHFFSPSTDVKLKHGILGLLKHIAQSSNVSPIIPRSLADAHIVQKINESAIWDEGGDAMAVIVQLNAIGVVKHLCNADVEHAIAAALPPPGADPDYKTALQKIMALVSRSDSVPIKSEGTRVLVNVIRTVLLRRNASLPSSARIPADKDKQQAIDTVMTPDNLNALSAFLARSGKFPILINEGVVAFNLICTQKGGANLVLDAILAPIQDGTIPEATHLSPVGSDGSSPLSPTAKKPFVARTALEMIANALRNVDNPAVYPIEIRANICTFLVQDATRLVLEKIREAKNEKEELLTNAATKVLEYWKSA
ncbi:hypothetical protein DFP72DRAFT_870286 [Ephemerocybe angulata]|uniref:Uncharacterized protein n=1 Tax=Ephemerocybe angulata TaxID=980116 RepID=A0A8H6IIN6_9AGAR|nr:hypothetical protein DFP72DRAFT_870286 [Tulosesus angulatus]